MIFPRPTPAYLRAITSLLLALACNSFLDIKYASGLRQVIIWAGMFAFSLSVGWRQRGERCARWNSSKNIPILGFVGLILWFIPMWGLPAPAISGGLTGSANCVLTNRRQLYFGLLVSLVAVMFAATHFRCDWTMLFLSDTLCGGGGLYAGCRTGRRRTEDLRQASLGHMVKQGPRDTTAAATAVIFTIRWTDLSGDAPSHLAIS